MTLTDANIDVNNEPSLDSGSSAVLAVHDILRSHRFGYAYV